MINSPGFDINYIKPAISQAPIGTAVTDVYILFNSKALSRNRILIVQPPKSKVTHSGSDLMNNHEG